MRPDLINTPLASLDFGAELDIAVRSCASASPLLPLQNQDNFLLIDRHGRAVFLRDGGAQHGICEDWPAGQVRLAVLDGMGGHRHGREAAEATVRGLLRMPACATLAQLGAQLDALHSALQTQFRRDGDDPARRPGTTLTLLELRPGLPPLLFHAGDSRLYEIDAERARALTIDHVPATGRALGGALDERTWWQKVHAEPHAQIAQAFVLGSSLLQPHRLDNALSPLDADNLPPFLRALADRRALRVRNDATYLLATDGFWACQQPQDWINCWPALLAGTGYTSAQLMDRLFDTFIRYPPAGLQADNLTALIIRFLPPLSG